MTYRGGDTSLELYRGRLSLLPTATAAPSVPVASVALQAAVQSAPGATAVPTAPVPAVAPPSAKTDQPSKSHWRLQPPVLLYTHRQRCRKHTRSTSSSNNISNSNSSSSSRSSRNKRSWTAVRPCRRPVNLVPAVRHPVLAAAAVNKSSSRALPPTSTAY